MRELGAPSIPLTGPVPTARPDVRPIELQRFRRHKEVEGFHRRNYRYEAATRGAIEAICRAPWR